jgi:hypothetical protein
MLNNIIAKEYLQLLEHQKIDPNVIKKEIRTQDLKVDVKGQLGKLTIYQLYNQKFKKKLHYR